MVPSPWLAFTGIFETPACAAGTLPGDTSLNNENGNFLIIDPSELKAEKLEDEAGIGVRVVQSSDTFAIGSVMDGGPAARAGLKSGDEVVSINGRRCLGMPLSVVTQALRGRSGTLVVLTVRNKASKKMKKFSFNRVPFSAFGASRKKDVALRDFAVKDFGGTCPKEHRGCHFLYQESDRCLFTCREKP